MSFAGTSNVIITMDGICMVLIGVAVVTMMAAARGRRPSAITTMHFVNVVIMVG
jgi:hypothetical protein